MRLFRGVPLTVPLVWSDVHEGHAPQLQTVDGQVHDHPETPARPELIREALEAAGLVRLVAPVAHEDALLDAVHEPTYREFIRDTCAELEPGVSLTPTRVSLDPEVLQRSDPAERAAFYAFGQDAPLMQATYRAAREAVDVALTGADLVREGAADVFALCRPPGHHAEHNRMGGFCYFNNAVAAAHRLSGDGRVAILDVDYHHGNGTQHLTYTRDDILYVSLHADPRFAYPGFSGHANERGRGAGLGFNLNLPLPPHMAIDAYLEELERGCEAIAAFDPRTVVVSLGFDTHREDPIAILGLWSEDFGRVAERIASLGRPRLHVLEGGYALSRLGESAVAYVQGLAGGATDA